MTSTILLLALAAGALAPARAQDGPGDGAGAASPRALVRRGSLGPGELAGLELSAWTVAELAGGRRELVLLAADGRVRQWRSPAPGAAPALAGELRLASPERALVAFEPPGDGRAARLVVAGPEGLAAHGLDADGLLAPAREDLAPRARFLLRTGGPRLARILQDVDGDGLLDLVLPGEGALELWLRRGSAGGGEGPGDADAAPFRRAGRVAADVSLGQSVGAEALTDRLRARVTVPDLAARDVNGDGRPDLVVEEGSKVAFHRFDPEQGYRPEPDVVLDLSIFRDATPAAGLRPGRTLVTGDDASLQSEDLDGDGILDHVVAHGRKVWVFHGSPDGPRFDEPVQILKSVEDVTFFFLLDLDDDGGADLLIGKLVVPTLPALLLGLVAGVEIDLSLAGYPSRGAEGFAREPRWHRELVLELPALLDLLRRPEQLMERLERIEAKFRIDVRADVDGDGDRDVALVTEDARSVEVWSVEGEDAGGEEETARRLRRLLLEDEDRTWDLERVFALLSETGERRTGRLTGSRPPDLALSLDELEVPAGTLVRDARAVDLDGDGREELLLLLEDEQGRPRFELLAVPR